MGKRPAIPAELERRILIEAGHRCAIPACRHPTIEIAHIEPWRKVKEHRFENLIALCPNCHTRYDKGEIDRKSLRIYKQNLGLLYSRYGEYEVRMLWYIGTHPKQETFVISAGIELMLMNLIRDGMLKLDDAKPPVHLAWHAPAIYVHVTEKGRAFAKRWLEARKLS
jgi:hypothetical protein